MRSNLKSITLRLSLYFLFLTSIAFSVSGQSDTLLDQYRFLDTLSKRTFNYFWDLAGKENGQVPDRWPNETFSSIAATGFGLAVYIVGVEKAYITRKEAAQRVYTTLKFMYQLPKGSEESGIAGYKGFFYHFLHQKSGLRYKKVELSTIDTGLLMAGILCCMSYFDSDDKIEREIRKLANLLFEEVDWKWAMNKELTMSMGWHPETGFIENRWKGYNEAMILYIMALGSPTHPIGPASWSAWVSSYTWKKHLYQEYVNFGPLFGHQYSHIFIDFREIQDSFMRSKGIDYFENSRRATIANMTYCVVNPGAFTGYGEKLWGISACDGPGNQNNADNNVAYKDYSARGCGFGYIQDDGTITPTASGGSIPFLPSPCIDNLYLMYQSYGKKIFKKYGFIDAFNLSIQNKDGTVGWYDPDYIGIDQGPIVLQLENYRTGIIWQTLKKNKYIVEGLKRAGFKGGWLK